MFTQNNDAMHDAILHLSNFTFKSHSKYEPTMPP